MARTALALALGVSLGVALGAQPRIETWPLCELVGPSRGQQGIYGTDLGFTFVHPFSAADGGAEQRLFFLFGDTWFAADSLCREPPPLEDDVQASLRLDDLPVYPPGPPSAGPGGARCPLLDFGPRPTIEPLRLYSDGERQPLGYIRTPLAGWSNGERVYAIFGTGELARCADHDDCPGGLECSRGELGICGAPPCREGEPCAGDSIFAGVLPDQACRLGATDCATSFEPHLRCLPLAEPSGVCVDPTSSLWLTARRRHGSSADSRTQVAVHHYLAVEDLEAPGTYRAVARLTTRKLLNPTARTIAFFAPEDPSRNEYRPGNHTLLIWGRPAFVSLDGTQAWPYLLYSELQPTMAGLSEWRPRYFAGLKSDGAPSWSEDPVAAEPLYTDEFDLVAQLSVSFVEPLGRWVMLYGGNLPDFFTAGGLVAHPQPVTGAVYLRHADHPWGPWSEPAAVVEPAELAGFLACAGPGLEGSGCASGDPYRPADFFRSRLLGTDCRAPGPRWDRGNLYGVNVIDVMTRALESPRDGGGCRVAEIYWNVSTWNPYRVLLMKSRIEMPPCRSPAVR